MTIRLMAALTAAALTLLATSLRAGEMPKAGDIAPPFSGQDQNGKTITLADLIGKKIVLLYFFPKAFTPGCTKEACGFRDRMGELQKDNVEVIGVSFDTIDRQKEFADKYQLNFPLIGDPDGKIAELYGAKMGILHMDHRVSFLIGLDGKIAHVTDASNPEVHFEEMKSAIAALNRK